MNVEKTIEFILEMQAKTEERFVLWEDRFAKWEQRSVKTEERANRRMDRLEQITKQLVRSGLSLRSDVRRLQQNLTEITGKLDALIDIVDKSIRHNGRAR